MLGLATGLALAIAQSANANTINIGTGLDGSGNPLAQGQLQTLYTVSGPQAYPYTSVPSGGTVNAAVAYYYGGPWVPNTTAGQWISPVAPADQTSYEDQAVGYYNYSLTIDGTGTISGQFSSDNPGALFVNGALTSAQGPGWGTLNDLSSYEYWVPFTVSVSGPTTIDFEVLNLPGGFSGNPTGLIVTGSATGNVNIPDGGLTVALLGGALAGLQALRRKLLV